MPDELNEQTQAAAQRLQNARDQKYGAETFQTMINAVGAAGVPQNVLHTIVTGPNALGDFTTLSQEALLRLMQNTDSLKDPAFRLADECYRNIRLERDLPGAEDAAALL
jgi:hypothetical protein